jgi:hypothetical protein
LGQQPVAQIVLELESGDPISGRIRGSGGPPTPFRGWLELSSKLDRLRQAGDSTDPEREPGPDA